MKNNLKIIGLIMPIVLLLIGFIYFRFLFITQKDNPHFLKIDRCLDLGGKWNYQENKCRYVIGMPKNWHVSPSKDPQSSTIYPLISWNNIQEIMVGMSENELKYLIHDIQNYHHPINAIVFTKAPDGKKYEVAIKLSKDLTVEDLSFKEINF